MGTGYLTTSQSPELYQRKTKLFILLIISDVTVQFTVHDPTPIPTPLLKFYV